MSFGAFNGKVAAANGSYQGQTPGRSDQARRASLAAIHRERISKIWNPTVSTSVVCRKLRGERTISFRDWLAGLERLVNAGFGSIARQAVQPVIDLVAFDDDDIGTPVSEGSDVIRISGEIFSRFFDMVSDGDGLTPPEAVELLPAAEKFLVETNEWVEAIRRRAAEINEEEEE